MIDISRVVATALFLGSFFGFATGPAAAQSLAAKSRMQLVGVFEGGQAGANIYKMFDPAEDVICYILTPELAGRKSAGNGKWIYDGNAVGSISCLKVRLPVVPISLPVGKR